MANVDTELILRKTVEHFKKSDPDIRGMLARSTVVWVQIWQADESASPERMKAGAGEWVCSHGSVTAAKEPVSLAIAKELRFVSKKPNLHLTKDDSRESMVYNFHFPGDAEGSESFDRIVHVLQSIMSGAAHSLVPLVQMETLRAPTTLHPTRMIKVDDLFPAAGCALPQGSSSLGNQNFKVHDVVPAVPVPVPTSVKASSNDTPSANGHSQKGCVANGPKTEAASPLTATELLAKLNSKVQVSVPLSNARTVESASTSALRGKGAGSMRNAPAPPPPIADKPPATPNIIAQLFGSAAAKTAHPASGQHATRDDAVADVRGTLNVMTPAEQGSSSQHDLANRVVTADSPADSPAYKRRDSAKQLVAILVRDDRFIDALADAMSEMSIVS